MKLRNFFRKKDGTPQKPIRTINVQTSYGSIEIVNLKRVWVNNYLGQYRLMYQDDNYNYNCIYWTPSPNNNYAELKQKLIDAYNCGDIFIEL